MMRPSPPPPLPTDVRDLQTALRRRREEMAALTQPAEPQEKKRMEPFRTKLDAQEQAHLEALIRRGAADDELTDWRQARRIHHKTFSRIVRDIRGRTDAPPSPAVVQVTRMETSRTIDKISPAIEPPAVITAPVARPAQIEPVIEWPTTIRAMRDELAQHGVKVAGALRIEIEL